MLLSLISLSDPEIDIVTTAVREWCRLHHCDIDSADGRRAITVAVNLVQSRQEHDCLLPELTQRLLPLGEPAAGLAQHAPGQPG